MVIFGIAYEILTDSEFPLLLRIALGVAIFGAACIFPILMCAILYRPFQFANYHARPILRIRGTIRKKETTITGGTFVIGENGVYPQSGDVRYNVLLMDETGAQEWMSVEKKDFIEVEKGDAVDILYQVGRIYRSRKITGYMRLDQQGVLSSIPSPVT